MDSVVKAIRILIAVTTLLFTFSIGKHVTIDTTQDTEDLKGHRGQIQTGAGKVEFSKG